MAALSRTSQHRELASNQWWEMLATAAKALFVLGVTPVLLRRLGGEGYGAFAIASSTLACVSAFDFGIRMRLRVELSDSSVQADRSAGARAFARSLGHYATLLAVFAVLALAVAKLGWWHRWTRSDGTLLAAAMLGSVGYSLSLLLLEPLAARGRLSLVKAAACVGSVLAIPVTVALLAVDAAPRSCFIGYAVALSLPNVAYALLHRTPEVVGLRTMLGDVTPAGFLGSLRAGRWFALTAVEWLLKTYLLTFLAGALLGPAAAGVYFILLKLSELVSVFGASASDTSTADLASLSDQRARAENLRASYSYSAAMCLVAFAGLACLGPLVFGELLHLPVHDPMLAILAGTFGLTAAFHRVVLTACMGVALTHLAALWGLAEIAIVLSGSLLLVPRIGLAGIFISGTCAGVALLPIARGIARGLDRSAVEVWLRPLLPLAPAFGCAIAAAWLGGVNGWTWLSVVGFLPAAATTAWRLWFRRAA